MSTLVKHHGSQVTYAKQDPALALISLFRPICRGPRPGGLSMISEYDGLTLKFNVWRAVDARDQSVLLAAVGLAGLLSDELKSLNAEVEHPRGQELWFKLQAKDMALQDKAKVLKTTKYAMLQAANMTDSGENYKTLEDCLERLSMIGCRAKKDGYDWSMHLLSYAQAPDGTLHIALNPRFADALVGQHIKISLFERKALTTEYAQILHAWLCAWLRPGKTNRIHVDKLSEKVWGNISTNDNTNRKRREKILKTLNEINDLGGWKASVEGRGLAAIATIFRPQFQILDI